MAALRNWFSRQHQTTTTSITEKHFHQAKREQDLFPKADPAVDGEDCLHDCDSCSVKFPRKFSIEEGTHLYGGITAFQRHLIVGTGKTDWIRDVSEIKNSVMQAVEKHKDSITAGRLMLSASNIPLPMTTHDENAATIILLPSFSMISPVTPAQVPELITHVINPSSTSTTPLPLDVTNTITDSANNSDISDTTDTLETPPISPISPSLPFQIQSCPHDYLVLLCSHGTRDARCGQSAPLLRKEFERHLRPLGLQRDLDDNRPGGVGIYFISHVGGHKFSANVIIYRRVGFVNPEITSEKGGDKQRLHEEAGQCIWLARVKPEHCENIVKYTLLQGKLIYPEDQLRGGFDRCKQLVSW